MTTAESLSPLMQGSRQALQPVLEGVEWHGLELTQGNRAQEEETRNSEKFLRPPEEKEPAANGVDTTVCLRSLQKRERPVSPNHQVSRGSIGGRHYLYPEEIVKDIQ
ncbi:hypothetical protein H8959_006900, partial [Pygathrix nigripes]